MKFPLQSQHQGWQRSPRFYRGRYIATPKDARSTPVGPYPGMRIVTRDRRLSSVRLPFGANCLINPSLFRPCRGLQLSPRSPLLLFSGISRLGHVAGSAVQPAQHCSKPACGIAFLKARRLSARKIASSSDPHVRRAIAKFPLEGATEFCAVTEAALLCQIEYAALIARIRQSCVCIEQTPMLNVMLDAAKSLEHAVQSRSRNAQFSLERLRSHGRVEQPRLYDLLRTVE